MSSQTVYFTNPTVISGIQSNITTLQSPQSLFDGFPYAENRFFNDNTGSFTNMSNWGVNLQQTRRMPWSGQNANYRAALTPDTAMSLQCQIQKPLGNIPNYTTTGTNLGGYNSVSSYNGVFDQDYFYQVCGVEAATYLGNISGSSLRGVLLGIDQQAYCNNAILVKINKHTGETAQIKLIADITGKPNLYYGPTGINDTGDSSTRGPLYLYGNYLYLTGQDTKYSSVYKINKSDLTLAAYTEIPSQFNQIVGPVFTGAYGSTTAPAFKTREMREVFVLPPMTGTVRPGLHPDFYTYPLVLAMSTVNNFYVYTNDNYTTRYQIFDNWFKTCGKVFAWFDKGSSFEYLYDFDMGPTALSAGDPLPSTWFGPTGPSDPVFNQKPYIHVPLYNGFQFKDFTTGDPTWSACETGNYMMTQNNISQDGSNVSTLFGSNPYPGTYTLDDCIALIQFAYKPGVVYFPPGTVFSTGAMYEVGYLGTGGIAGGIIGTGTATGSVLLGQPIRLYVKPGFVIPTGTLGGAIPGQSIATMAGHYGAGIWGTPCFDPKLGYMYIPGGNPMNFPQYERDVFNGALGEYTQAVIALNSENSKTAWKLMNDSTIKTKTAILGRYNGYSSGFSDDVRTALPYTEIEGFSTGAAVLRQKQRDMVDYVLAQKNQSMSARNKRLLDSSIVAIDPYYSRTGAALKWTYKMVEGGCWTVDSLLNAPGGLLRDYTQAFYGQGDLNMDVTSIMLVNQEETSTKYGVGASYTGPRVLVAQSKGMISLLNPDGYFCCTGVDGVDPQMKSGIAYNQAPLFGSRSISETGSEMSFIQDFFGYVQSWPGTIAHAVVQRDNGSASTSFSRNLLIVKQSGSSRQFLQYETGGKYIDRTPLFLPFARGHDNTFFRPEGGSITCYDLDTLCQRGIIQNSFGSRTNWYTNTGVNRNTVDLSKAVVWQVPIKHGRRIAEKNLFGYVSGGTDTNGDHNTGIIVYGNVLLNGTSQGVTECYDIRTGKLTGQFATVEPAAAAVTVYNNQIMFIGGYNKWNNANSLGFCFYKFTPNGK